MQEATLISYASLVGNRAQRVKAKIEQSLQGWFVKFSQEVRYHTDRVRSDWKVAHSTRLLEFIDLLHLQAEGDELQFLWCLKIVYGFIVGSFCPRTMKNDGTIR